MSICIALATVTAEIFATMSNMHYNPDYGDTIFFTKEWEQLAVPVRSVAVTTSSLAHWIFAEQYFKLSLLIPILVSQSTLTNS